MTDTETGVDQDLLPERSEAENKVWYLGGAGAAALSIGLLGLVDFAPSYEGLALVGGVMAVGTILWMVRA